MCRFWKYRAVVMPFVNAGLQGKWERRGIMAEHEGQSTAKARSKLPFVIVCLVIVAAAIAALTMFVLGTQGQEKQSAQSGEANHIEQTVQEPSVEPQYATGVHHVLLIGDDAWVPGPSRSDLIMLLRVDLDNYVLTEVSIPRDTAHQQPDGSLVKLNSVYESSGPDALCEAVSQLTGVQVDQYAVIGFDGLQSIVSYLGGLEVNVPYSITYSFYTHDYPDEVYQAGADNSSLARDGAFPRKNRLYAIWSA